MIHGILGKLCEQGECICNCLQPAYQWLLEPVLTLLVFWGLEAHILLGKHIPGKLTRIYLMLLALEVTVKLIKFTEGQIYLAQSQNVQNLRNNLELVSGTRIVASVHIILQIYLFSISVTAEN